MHKPDPIFEKLKVAAPSVVFTVSRTLDPYVSWDGEPEDDPREKGMCPYDVDFKARTIVNGELIEQMESLGASWYDPEEPIGDAHGYLPQKLEDAASGLLKQLQALDTRGFKNVRQRRVVTDTIVSLIKAMEVLKAELKANYDRQQRFSHTHPNFQRVIMKISSDGGLAPMDVYAMWENYCKANYDQSHILSEFIANNKAKLGIPNADPNTYEAT
jgi:hypothetical protein